MKNTRKHAGERMVWLPEPLIQAVLEAVPVLLNSEKINYSKSVRYALKHWVDDCRAQNGMDAMGFSAVGASKQESKP